MDRNLRETINKCRRIKNNIASIPITSVYDPIKGKTENGKERFHENLE